MKTQTCACCNQQADDPHHIIGHGQREMGTKCHDLFVIPLCRAHHDELHRDVRTFEEKYGSQKELLFRFLDYAIAVGVIGTVKIKSVEKVMRDMSQVLELWGAWAASDNSGIDWQPIAAGFKSLIPDYRKVRFQCNDDEGILIDGCVARLRKYKLEEYELIIAHFVMGISLRKIAKKRKCSDGTIRKQLQNAIGFIEAVAIMTGFN